MSAWTRREWDSASTSHWRIGRPHSEPLPRPITPANERLSRIAAPRVLFVNQYYWPDHASTAQHLSDLAESLAEHGYDCHVICGRRGYAPGGKRLKRREVHRGVTIHRVAATSFGRKTTAGRMSDYLSFYRGAALRAFSLPRFDVAVTLTTPPMISLVGSSLRRVKGTRHVLWSMDLHPDASLALGSLNKRNPLVAGLAALSDASYRGADRVVALGPFMADRIARKGVRDSRLETIPVWSRADEIEPASRDQTPLRAQLDLVGKFVVMYSGNLGIAHAFDEFLEAARRLRGRDDIVFLFAGAGPRKQEVARVQQAEALPNVRLIDYVPREQLGDSLSLADVHLVSMRAEMAGIVVPGKLYGAMAAARPVVFVGPDHCETAATVREANCGFTVRLGDVDGLVTAIERLAGDSALRTSLGENGRGAFLAEHEREVCCASWRRMLDALLGRVPTVALPANMNGGRSTRGVARALA